METGRTTPDGNPSFKSSAMKTEAQEKQRNTARNISENKKRSQTASKKQRNNKKIEETKSAGASFISRYFRGFTTQERANIKADLDDTIPYRIIDNYQSSIQSYATWRNFSNADELKQKLDTQLFGAISLGMATKLHLSSTETEKKANKLLSSLETKIILPKKLGVLLDQLGKTDVPGDNHFRIRNQNFAAKRHLARAVYNLIPEGQLSEYMVDNKFGMKFQDLQRIMENPELFSNMVDDTTWSHDRIKTLGKQIYQQASKSNFVYWKDKTKRLDQIPVNDRYYLRLPQIDFDKISLVEIGNLMSSLIFTQCGFDLENMAVMASGLVLSVAKLNWIKNPTTNMENLDASFGGTWFAGKTFNQILAYCGIWNLSYFFDDLTLNNLALEAIRQWNNGYSRIFSTFLEMNEIPFSEHGSDAQLIQVDKSFISKVKGIMDYATYGFMKKSVANTVLKVGENNSLLGVMIGYTKNLSFESDWEVEFNSTNKAILYEFLKNDFKDNY